MAFVFWNGLDIAIISIGKQAACTVLVKPPDFGLGYKEDAAQNQTENAFGVCDSIGKRKR